MNIFVAKLGSRTTEEGLKKLFDRFGEVTSIKIIIDRETGKSKGYGFVEMVNTKEAWSAINELNDSEFEGSRITLKKSEPRTQQGGGNYGNKKQGRVRGANY